MKNGTLIGIALLLFSVIGSMWVYRAEVTATVDPNDNTFQFALVERTNQILDFAQQNCSGIFTPFCTVSLLTDHWVPNWAEGYNLPYYYSHIPQMVIVLFYRLYDAVGGTLSLFSFYHFGIYLLLCLFPLSIALSFRILGMSWFTAGVGALIGAGLSTDGLYGLDASSYLWRGYGLSSQLFAAVWLAPALAASYRVITADKDKLGISSFIAPVLLLAATTAGHLGIGIIAFFSIAILTMSPSVQSLANKEWNGSAVRELKKRLFRAAVILGGVLFLLSYWILPILLHNDYHNISVWDGIWKFNSFGYREVLSNLFNGTIFDFGRFPLITLIIGVGFFVALPSSFFPFAVLFLFWLLMYFGRTTWGGLFSLIPGMSEFHLSRFIVGVHIAGVLLAGVAAERMLTLVAKQKYLAIGMMSVFGILLTIFLSPPLLSYAKHNAFLIDRANKNASAQYNDADKLIHALKSRINEQPGRVFAGRGGSWGKGFRIAETPMYMHLSTYGIPVVLWLPETWSPNSDIEQYFSEANPDHYTLFNVRYVATPADLQKEYIQPFWRLLETGETWKLYEVETEGYISGGLRPAIVSADKQDYRSVVRLWMHGAYLPQKLYPELTFNNSYPKQTGLPNFRMLDEVTYRIPDGSTHNLFAEVPHYVSSGTASAIPRVTDRTSESDMVFRATVEVPQNCVQCIVVLRQTFHPSWTATMDGKPIPVFTVFPFFAAVSVTSPGIHELRFAYVPSTGKQFLLLLGLTGVVAGFVVLVWNKKKR
ncbi:MAG: hypothetical protein ACOY3M_01390 [Patescibacteria group bacterium]